MEHIRLLVYIARLLALALVLVLPQRLRAGGLADRGTTLVRSSQKHSAAGYTQWRRAAQADQDASHHRRHRHPAVG